MELIIESIQQKAIDKAQEADWKGAIELHTRVLDMDSDNIDSLLASGYAHMQLKEYTEAGKLYRKALLIEPGNGIARNNLDKLSVLRKRIECEKVKKRKLISPEQFINVRGKTKVCELVNTGQAEVLAQLSVGEEIYPQIKKRRLELRNEDGEYVGVFADDMCRRLMFFISEGSDYKFYVKSARKNNVEVFITEVKKGKKVVRYISFPSNVTDDLKNIMRKTKNVDDDSDDYNECEEDEKGDDDETDDTEEIAPTDLESLAEIQEKDDDDDDDLSQYTGYNEDDDE